MPLGVDIHVTGNRSHTLGTLLRRLDYGCPIALLVGLGAFGAFVLVSLVVEQLTEPPYGSDGPHSGWSAAWAGDVDGDGAADVLVSTQFEPDPAGGYGCTRVFSGRTGARLWTSPGMTVWRGDLCAAGDVNGDGKSDLFVDRWDRPRVIDLASGRALLDSSGEQVECFGALRDVDHDGCDELVVRDEVSEDVNRVRLISGKTGATLWSRKAKDVVSSGVHEWFAGVGCVIGDVDRDGIEDLAVNTETERIRVLSGASGATMRDFAFTFESLGGLFRVDDLDGDGAADLLAACGNGKPVRALSPATGRELFAIAMERYESPYGVATRADFDGDGVGDLALPRTPGLIVYSGRDGRRIDGFDHVSPADGAEDVNGDGVREILVVRNVGAQEAVKLGDDVWRAGSVEIRSARDGVVLRRWDSGSLEPLRKR